MALHYHVVVSALVHDLLQAFTACPLVFGCLCACVCVLVHVKMQQNTSFTG